VPRENYFNNKLKGDLAMKVLTTKEIKTVSGAAAGPGHTKTDSKGREYTEGFGGTCYTVNRDGSRGSRRTCPD